MPTVKTAISRSGMGSSPMTSRLMACTCIGSPRAAPPPVLGAAHLSAPAPGYRRRRSKTRGWRASVDSAVESSRSPGPAHALRLVVERRPLPPKESERTDEPPPGRVDATRTPDN